MRAGMKPRLEKAMRGAPGMAAVAVLAVAIAPAAPPPAQGAEAIRAGKWEFATQVQVSNLPKLPPGVKLPPGINIGPGGIAVTRTTCVDPAAAIPPDLHPPTRQHGQCKVDRLDRDGGTVRWLTTCTTPQGKVRSEGVAHYRGDRMEATMTTHMVAPGGHAQDSSQHVTGRYLGPCDGR
jgi:hypothetical protein